MVTYSEAGVDIDKGAELVRRIARFAPSIGGFSGLYPFGEYFLAGATDGVGTKLKLAFALDRHDTVGIDLVAMCVNDLITSGAKPLFFLDYFATSNLDVERAEKVIRGIARGCDMAGCTLLGGETAELPGFYAPREYDLSGCAVGVVAQDRVVDGSRVSKGDLIVGLPSSGLHSNGFSLVQRAMERADIAPFPELLEPTRIYVHEALTTLECCDVHALAHITGGGLEENVGRVIPSGLSAVIDYTAWQRPAIFEQVQEWGNIAESEMRRVFNLGMGLLYIVPEREAHKCGGEAIVLGEVV